MMSDELKEALREVGKYDTAVRRELRRHEDAVHREETNHECRLMELRGTLSPAAARIVVAAEIEEHVPAEVFHTAPNSAFEGDGIVATLADPNPAPDWMNAEPKPLPPGHLIEVAEKQGKRARG